MHDCHVDHMVPYHVMWYQVRPACHHFATVQSISLHKLATMNSKSVASLASQRSNNVAGKKQQCS